MMETASHGSSRHASGSDRGRAVVTSTSRASARAYTIDAYDWYDADSGACRSTVYTTGVMVAGSSYEFSY